MVSTDFSERVHISRVRVHVSQSIAHEAEGLMGY